VADTVSSLIRNRAELWNRSTPETLSYREVSGWSAPLLDDSLKTDGGLGSAFCLSFKELQLMSFYNKGASGNLAEEIAIDPCSLAKPG